MGERLNKNFCHAAYLHNLYNSFRIKTDAIREEIIQKITKKRGTNTHLIVQIIITCMLPLLVFVSAYTTYYVVGSRCAMVF